MRINLNTSLQCVVWNACGKVHVRYRSMSAWEALVSCRETLRQDFTRLAWNISLGDVLRSRSGYCDLKGFQVDLSATFFLRPTYVFLDRKNVRKYFLETHCWRFTWNFNVGWIFVLGQNSMPSRLGVLLGTPGTSKTSISDVRCTKLSKSSKLTTLEKSRGEIWKWATKYLCWFS